jgi:hypothetical protein
LADLGSIESRMADWSSRHSYTNPSFNRSLAHDQVHVIAHNRVGCSEYWVKDRSPVALQDDPATVAAPRHQNCTLKNLVVHRAGTQVFLNAYLQSNLLVCRFREPRACLSRTAYSFIDIRISLKS